ncbi:PTS beta-glucoside transporter subunit EIIBCA [Blautia sp. An249]|uniref:PTS beta-glucoside transporter subunit IIBCA n=1 Tax=Blautia sp. An249 TaxID=1965603 RepID=UPI000B3A3681|nr:PTS transporter subunit IIBCA [Blautia sp. An249]OUO80733.1 PTS beta-glucoside transporter subunit EIIBCA [Blautia sp. An249]
MDAEKRKRYERIAEELVRLAGGRDNILGVAHCATRLRLVLEDNDKADTRAIEDVDLVKGVFVAGDQLQIIFGAGLVNDVCQVLADSIHMDSMSLGDLKTKANKRMNPLQRAVKALSDVFIEIMPGILAAALLTGLSSVLGNIEFVQNNDTLYGLSRLINISSGAIFGFLPLCVAYSTVKRFGGRPIMGIVIGCIMLTNSLADAGAAAQGTVDVTTLHIFGLPVDLIGFQGGIIVALLIGIVTAKLDIFFEKKVPEVIRLLVSPLLTTLVSSFLLFMIIGPVGRGLANGITAVLVWMTQHLGVFGYAAFSGVQQLIVITGLHHVFGAIESQLLVDTGRNFLNPLMSVAIIAQGGAVLGYLVRNLKDAKAKELCIPSFISVLFGITEPALFGVNLRYRYPIIGGCLGGAVGGAIVYFTDLAALGFGTTVVPGIALADPTNNGYVSYIIAHVAAVAAGFIFAFLLGIVFDKRNKKAVAVSSETTETAAVSQTSGAAKQELPEEILAFTSGEFVGIEKVKDPTFSQKVLGDGVAILPTEGKIYAPADCTVEMVMDTKHAVGLRTKGGNGLLLHVGIDTVQLGGKYFQVHVKEGQTLKAGDSILDFDKDKIAGEGYDTAACLIFTEPLEGVHADRETERTVAVGDKIAVFTE